MRTDSPAVSPEGEAMARQTITQHYGVNYVGQHPYGAKGNAQEAHECIRPTDSDTSPDTLRLTLGTGHEPLADLYDLIWRRFLASQMAAALYNDVQVTVSGGEAIFSVRGSQLAFDGFLRVYALSEEQETVKSAEDASTDNELSLNDSLPLLTHGESLTVRRLTPQQHFTQPPTRFTEALLVKTLEGAGVGRPSTYAQTIATLKQRDYVALEKRKLTPTALGQQVNRVLVDKLPTLFAVDFTAQMETALDQIAAGKQDSRAYLKGFWGEVAPLFGDPVIAATVGQSDAPAEAGKGKRAAKVLPPVDAALGVCPTCGKPLVSRTGKYGAFVGCSGFPTCRYVVKPT
jgi:DNA topoisomerase-1